MASLDTVALHSKVRKKPRIAAVLAICGFSMATLIPLRAGILLAVACGTPWFWHSRSRLAELNSRIHNHPAAEIVAMAVTRLQRDFGRLIRPWRTELLIFASFAVVIFTFASLDSLRAWYWLTPYEWLASAIILAVVTERTLAFAARTQSGGLNHLGKAEMAVGLREPGKWEMAHFAFVLGLCGAAMLASLGFVLYGFATEVGEPVASSVKRLGWNGAWNYWLAKNRTNWELIGEIVFVSAVIDTLRLLLVDQPYLRKLEGRLRKLEEALGDEKTPTAR